MIEFLADHPEGGSCQHRGPRELVEPLAETLRQGGWSIVWKPLEERDYSRGTGEVTALGGCPGAV